MATAMQENFPILEQAVSSFSQIEQKCIENNVCVSLNWALDHV